MEKSIKITLLSASLFALIGVTEAMDMSFDNYDNETSSINIRKTSKLGGNTTKFNNVSKNANLADFIDKKFKENIRTKAEDVLFPNGGNNFIYNDNYLRNYWAYDALVDKSSKFYQSIQNLKYIVLKEQSSVLGENYRRPTIAWTDKPYKSYFAQYNWAIDHIKVNDVLNSRSVPRETMKFLIYHECLHQLIHRHGTEFRRLERLYPDFTEHEHFLDYKFPDFYREKAM